MISSFLETRAILVSFVIKKSLSKKKSTKFKADIAEEYGAEPNISTVSTTVGKELAKNAIVCIVLLLLGIVVYVAFRFEWRMGVATIIGLIHDVFFMVAVFSILRLKSTLHSSQQS